MKYTPAITFSGRMPYSHENSCRALKTEVAPFDLGTAFIFAVPVYYTPLTGFERQVWFNVSIMTSTFVSKYNELFSQLQLFLFFRIKNVNFTVQ